MNAYALRCLPEMGVNIRDLGCVMLDVEMPDLSEVIPEEWAYTSANSDLAHVSGIQTKGHVTLLFGLLQNAHTIRGAIDEVLSGWEPGRIRTETITSFPSPLASEPYACIVAEIGMTNALRDAHSRLSLLPHIDTHPEYRAHVTLAYVQQDRCAATIQAFRTALGTRDIFTCVTLNVIGLNYGDEPKGN